MKLKTYLQTATTFVSTHKKKFIIGGSIVLGVVIVGGLVAAGIYTTAPKKVNVVYQPTDACKLFTTKDAQTLIGGADVINLGTQLPVAVGDFATSKCSYTDKNPSENNMVVAAVAIRSGVNDAGVAQNKADFATKTPTSGIQTVTGLGDTAYFNAALGQLNIYKGRDWYILSYGIGATPASNTLDDAMKLANVVLN